MQEPRTPIHFDPNALDGQSFPPTWREKQLQWWIASGIVILVHLIVIATIGAWALIRSWQ